jgi:hypothetical protein
VAAPVCPAASKSMAPAVLSCADVSTCRDVVDIDLADATKAGFGNRGFVARSPVGWLGECTSGLGGLGSPLAASRSQTRSQTSRSDRACPC